MSRTAPKRISGGSRFQQRSRGDSASIFFGMIGATWAILDIIWCPAGNKRLTKSSFSVPSRTKILKNEAQNEASKNT